MRDRPAWVTFCVTDQSHVHVFVIGISVLGIRNVKNTIHAIGILDFIIDYGDNQISIVILIKQFFVSTSSFVTSRYVCSVIVQICVTNKVCYSLIAIKFPDITAK